MSKTDTKRWVTIRVPEEDRDAAKDIRPDDATHGDCLVAGAKVLAGEAPTEANPEGRVIDESTAREIVDELAHEAGGPEVDDEEIANAVVRQFDYAALADTVAERVLEEVTRR